MELPPKREWTRAELEAELLKGLDSEPVEMTEAVWQEMRRRFEERHRLGVNEEIDEVDQATVEESERQIARGEDLDWTEVSERLRKKYLGG